MTEKELRNNVITIAKGYLGYTEANAGDDKIIDTYNSIRPSGGYKMTHTDAWCAAFTSVCGYEAGLSDIIPINCSCEKMIEKFKKLGRWQEDGTITPQVGDLIFYDWDSKAQPTDGWADHVGIVKSVSAKYITAIEGNYDDAVKERKIAIDNRFIRGYGLPDYVSKAAQATTTESTPTNDYYPYLVKVKASALNVRTGVGKETKIVKVVKSGEVYTIVAEQKASDGSLWGRLKSGAGWISLSYTKRV